MLTSLVERSVSTDGRLCEEDAPALSTSRARRLTRAVAAGVLAVGAVGLTAGSAQALGEFKYWNSATSPLTVTGYGSTGRAYGGWRLYTGTDGTRAYTDANMKVNNAANHRVYVQSQTWLNAGLCVSPQYTSCSSSYYYHATATSNRISSSSWTWHYGFSTGLDGSADFARAAIRARLDIPWRTDPSAGPTYTNGSKY